MGAKKKTGKGEEKGEKEKKMRRIIKIGRI